jgi:cytosine permease
MLSERLPLAGVVFCTIIGGLILLVCACFVGMQSSTSGLPSTVVSADGLGLRGARFVPALLITITSVGWFGVQAAVCGASFSAMMAEDMGIFIPAWAATLFWGLVMGLVAMQGYRILRHFYRIIVPVLSVIVLFVVIHRVFFSEAGSLAALSAWRPAEPMSHITAITLLVGTWAMGAYTAGDYCRYTKKPRDAVLGISAGVVAIPVMILSGAIIRIVTGNADITVVLNGMGYPAMSLVFLILSVWTINVMNACFGGIALSVLLGFEEKRLKLATVLTALVGTALGALGILSRFTDFLSLLSSFIPPLIGVLAGAKMANALGRKTGDVPLLSGKSSGEGEKTLMKPGFHIPGLAAYALGALTAWLTATVFPFFIPPLNGIVIAAAAYVILAKLIRIRAKTG